jgi:hypothetical protein
MKIFGRLITDEIPIKKNKAYFYKCFCICGNVSIVERNSLKHGKVISCGCYQKEVTKRKSSTHNMWGTKTYWAWAQARQRYSNSKSPAYKDYGGRGITMCKEWSNSFESFFNDMGECPQGFSLDRLNNDLGYFKDNCHWASKSYQGYNRRKDNRNTSGKTGVSFMNTKNKWRAYITVNSKQINLGLFISFQEAVFARNEAELKYYGKNKL